jgi:uncharacterized protein HemY
MSAEDAENEWWGEMPDKIRADVEASLAEAERGRDAKRANRSLED